jgi:hypothetical protein
MKALSNPTIVAICGEKGHGKDTAARVLVNCGFRQVAFAGALKAMTRAYLEYRGVEPDVIEMYLEGSLKETPDDLFGGKTCREFMQKLGTEFGRNMIDDNIWIDSFDDHCSLYSRVACTDLRFPNENQHLTERGAIQMRVVSPNKERNAYSLHPSEQYIADLDVEVEIINDGTVAELHDKVWSAMVDHLPAKGEE